MKFKVGDLVTVKSKEWYDANKDKNGIVYLKPYDFTGVMYDFCGLTATIKEVYNTSYTINIDDIHCWTDEMFEDEAVDVVDSVNYGWIHEEIKKFIDGINDLITGKGISDHNMEDIEKIRVIIEKIMMDNFKKKIENKFKLEKF